MRPYSNVYCFITIAYLIHHGWTNKKEILHEANMVWMEDYIKTALESRKKK